VSVEERVRAALAGRAGEITADRLQPAMPPTVAVPRPGRGVRGLPILAAAAAAVIILFAVILMVRPAADVPVAPATPTSVPSQPSPATPGHAKPVPVAPGREPSAAVPPAGKIRPPRTAGPPVKPVPGGPAPPSTGG